MKEDVFRCTKCSRYFVTEVGFVEHFANIDGKADDPEFMKCNHPSFRPCPKSKKNEIIWGLFREQKRGAERSEDEREKASFSPKKLKSNNVNKTSSPLDGTETVSSAKVSLRDYLSETRHESIKAKSKAKRSSLREAWKMNSSESNTTNGSRTNIGFRWN